MVPAAPIDLVGYLSTRGLCPAAELLAASGLSQPTLSRRVAAEGARVVRIGRARATHYAAHRDIPSLGASQWPLYRIGPAGDVGTVGRLHALARNQWYLECDSDPLLAFGVSNTARPDVFEGLPWFLEHLRPQGFIGRALARRCARELPVPDDLARWSDDHVLTVATLRGGDLPGDLVLGDRALEQAQSVEGLLQDGHAIPPAQRPGHYAELADAALRGDPVGSSAGGEQPKFTAVVDDGAGSVPRPVLVKFTAAIDTPTGRRWADLLIAEAIAAETLGGAGMAVADTQVFVESERGRLFLEVSRFDRVGPRGRRGYVSLAAIDSALYGAREHGWLGAADRLERDGRLVATEANALRLLGCFGSLIGNTDMHYGNVGFWTPAARELRLAPAFDMLPMLYAPSAGGELPPRDFVPRLLQTPSNAEAWAQAAPLAIRFWRSVADDGRVSAEFRGIAAANRQRVTDLLPVLGAGRTGSTAAG